MSVMKLFRILGRNIRDAIKSVFRNFSLSLASISCITITLIIVALSILSSYNVRNFTTLIKEDFTVVAFLNNNITEDNIASVQNQVKNMGNVESVSLSTKQQVADSMMKTSDVFKSIMSSWTSKDNPLSDTLSIKVKDTNKIGETANQIKKIDGVSIVKYGAGMVEELLSVFRAVENGLIVIVILLIFVTAFLITNTIKLTIFSRRKEIEIMRLVGASNINIEIPFIVEGLLLGILGAVIPILLVIYGYTAVYSNFNGKLFSPFIRLVQPEPFIYVVSLLLLVLGIIVGMVGSFRAVRKYLKI